MKAAQFMYTSWRNAPNHGFSLYSMTPGLSNTDCEDISKMMKYVLQPGMPRDPSDEEIASVLPRNVAFFPLSSGKFCLAQSSYVGREYRGFEEGGRLGNYLLHAYILEDVKDAIPMSFVGDDIFRFDLTREEWQATNPAPLPVVELPPVGKMLTQSEINSFFDAARTETLEKLVQAIVTASAGGKTVFFNDDNKNMRFWYKALAVCLPPVCAGKTAFNTFSLSMTLPVGVSPCCKLGIMNVSASKDAAIPITAPNLAEETRKGNFVIDLVRGAYSPVTVGTYAKTVCAKFKANFFDAVNFAKKIDATVAKYSCSADQAMDILCFAEGKLEQFATIGEVLKVIRLLGGTPDAQMQASIARLAERIVGGAYPYGNELCEAIRTTVYPNVPSDGKQKLLAYVMENALSANAPGKAAYAQAINAALPCDKATAACYVYENKLYDRLLGGDVNRIHYLATLTIENYRELNARFAKLPSMMLNTVVAKYLSQADVASVEELISLSPDLTGTAIAVVLRHYAEKQTLGQLSMDVFFRMLPKASLGCTEVVSLMTAAIGIWGKDASFCTKYEAFAATNAQADAALRATPACISFFDEMEIHRFRTGKPTVEGLCNYFAKIYSKRPDDTAFEAKMTEYLKLMDWKTCMRESITIYSRCFKLKQGWTPNDLRIVQILRRNVLDKPSRRDLAKMLLTDAVNRSIVDGFVKDTEAKGCGRDPFYATVSAFAEIISRPAKQAAEAIKTQTLLSGLLVTKEATVLFNQNLMEDYLAYALEAIKASKSEDYPWLITALLPLTADEASFKKALSELLASKEKEALKRTPRILGALLLHVSTEDKPNKTLNTAFEDYFLSVGKKERLAVHKASVRMTSDKKLIAKSLEFVTEFNAKHKTGFFDKLKGLFGNK